MHIFGLTGGIGSGKSTVAAMFKQAGVHVLDADALARSLLEPGESTHKKIVEALGYEILSPHAPFSIDRNKLASIVFAQKDARNRLEDILHPVIWQRSQDAFSLWEKQGARWCLYEAALLVETARYKQLQGLVVVDVPISVQVARACARGMKIEDVQRRMEAQATREQRRAVADWIIDNAGDPKQTEDQVRALCTLLENTVSSR